MNLATGVGSGSKTAFSTVPHYPIRNLTGGFAVGDTLLNVENLRGSRYSDILIGDRHDNNLHGWGEWRSAHWRRRQ